MTRPIKFKASQVKSLWPKEPRWLKDLRADAWSGLKITSSALWKVCAGLYCGAKWTAHRVTHWIFEAGLIGVCVTMGYVVQQAAVIAALNRVEGEVLPLQGVFMGEISIDFLIRASLEAQPWWLHAAPGLGTMATYLVIKGLFHLRVAGAK